MGIFDIFKRKKEPEKPAEEAAPTEVHIDEVHDWVNQTLSGKIRDRHEKANELYSDIMKGFAGIKESSDRLEGARFEGEEKVGAVVNMTKDLFVKRVHNLVNSIQAYQGRPVDFRVLRDFEQASAEALSDMSSITPKQAFLLSTYFPKESSPVIEKIKETQEKVSVMREFLEAEGETIQLAHSIKSRKEQQSLLKLKLSTVEKEESGIEMRIRDLRNRSEKNLAEIEGIVKGHEYEQYNSLAEQVEKARKKSSAIKEKVTAELTSVQRPLKKLEYLAGKGYPMEKEEEQVLEGLINRPFETLEKNQESRIRDMLLLARKAYFEERMSLKDSERERLDDMISRLDSDMKELKAAYQETGEEIKEMERDKGRYEWAIERKDHLESNIKRALEEIASLEKLLNTSGQDKENIRKEMVRQRQELEEIIYKSSGKKVSIVVPEEKEEGSRTGDRQPEAVKPSSPSGKEGETPEQSAS